MERHAYIPTSVVLEELIGAAPEDCLTLDWLLDSLHKRSFGIIMLLLALLAMAPGISVFIGPMLAVPALQMAAGRRPPPPLPAPYRDSSAIKATFRRRGTAGHSRVEVP